MAKPVEIIKLEKLGKVHTWSLYKKQVRGTASQQRAYAAGFRARIQDWFQERNAGEPVKYRRKIDAAAYALGYSDARQQEA